MSTYAPDCNAVTPEQECGECESCEESAYQAIENDVEAGVISDAEARQAHAERYHYDD